MMSLNDCNLLEIDSFPNLCRTCGSSSNELISIDKVSEVGISLKEIIINWTNLEYKDDNQLPRNMCKPCIKSMYQLYHFLFNCNRVQNIFNEVVKKSNDNFEQIVDIKQEIEEIEVIPVDNLITTEQTENELITDTVITTKVERKRPGRKSTKQTLTDCNKIIPSVNSSIFRQGPPYKCITCDAIYDQYDDLIKHKLEMKHRERLNKYKCSYCSKVYGHSAKFREHVRTHTGEKPYKCTTCGKGFGYKQSYQQHVLIHNGIKPYKCKICNQSFSQKPYLVDHGRKHSGEKLICFICGKHFLTSSSLKFHEKIHKIQDPSALTCELCSKVLSSEAALKAHMLLHGPKILLCEICSKTFATKPQLQSHIKFSHQNPKFPCNVCGQLFSIEITLREHQTRCAEKKFNCDLCGKKYSSKITLQRHNRIHAGDTTYQCKECSRICSTRQLLEYHMRVHTGEKPYSCERCGKSFKQRTCLKQHIKIHAAEKTHQCTLCDKRFYTIGTMKRHISDKHEKQNSEKTS